jgi:hypothetical protein
MLVGTQFPTLQMIMVPSSSELSNPKILLDPKDKGIMIL